MSRQAAVWEKIVSIHLSNKEHVCKIYKDYIKTITAREQ